MSRSKEFRGADPGRILSPNHTHKCSYREKYPWWVRASCGQYQCGASSGRLLDRVAPRPFFRRIEFVRHNGPETSNTFLSASDTFLRGPITKLAFPPLARAIGWFNTRNRTGGACLASRGRVYISLYTNGRSWGWSPTPPLHQREIRGRSQHRRGWTPPWAGARWSTVGLPSKLLYKNI